MADNMASTEQERNDGNLHSVTMNDLSTMEIVSPTPSPVNPDVSRKLTIFLFVSHFLSTWNSRLFEMGAVLFIAAIYPETLLPVSIYALARSGAAVVFSAAIGICIDTFDRLIIVRISIIGQRLAVAGSCGLFLVLYTESQLPLKVQNGLFAISVLLACVEKLCSIMNLVSIERDWAVVITQNNLSVRQTLNARLRRIDLFCKLMGPLGISLVNGGSTTVAIWLTLGFSCASAGVEYFTIARVYYMVPALDRNPTFVSTEDPLATSDVRRKFRVLLRRSMLHVFPSRSFSFYLHHKAFLPSFSLALLYLTVLSFSGQMITYLLAAGYTSIDVGIARTVSTIFELSATWIARQLQHRIGSVRGGIWSVSWQTVFLIAGLAWFVSYGQSQGYQNVTTASGLVAGVILSRVGLWSFDLCTQNIVQDEVEENQRGAFSTVEAALQNLFELLSYVTTIVFSRADQFLWPSVISAGVTYTAGGCYALFIQRRRGHLLHRPPCLRRSRR